MNAQQPYEKHLADKLRDIKPPGSSTRSWPQMKELLDRELPNAGGGGNGRGWWIAGTIVALLIIGTWFGSSMLNDESVDNNVAKTNAKADNTQPSSNNSAPIVNEEKQASKEIDSKSEANESKNLNSNTSDTKSTQETSSSEVKNAVDKSISNEPVNKSNPAAIDNKELPDNSANDNAITVSKNSSNERSEKAKSSFSNAGLKKVNTDYTLKAKESNRPRKNEVVVFNKKSSGRVDGATTVSKNNKPLLSKTNTKEIESGDELNVISESSSIEESNAKATMISGINGSASALTDISAQFPDSLSASYALDMPMKARSRFKTNSARVKALKNRVVGTGDNKNLAIGLSLPLAFPLSDQKAFAYNINAGANTALDYLPVPHLQYHINQKSYIQAEIQFASPQFIHPALLYESKYERVGAQNYRFMTNSVYAKKLYYFNLPIGVHYSPFKNFYLGSGVQFSSLMSGVALYEQRGYSSWNPAASDSLFSQSIQKFRNDTVSNRLNSNEFRVMLDANYYWERFTVGLRYNQALSNYVSLRVNNLSPLITDKNKSMQFYLRYNLWEDKKRKKPGGLAIR